MLALRAFLPFRARGIAAPFLGGRSFLTASKQWAGPAVKGSILDDGIEVHFGDEVSVFPFIWLKDNCSKGREETSRQKKYSSLSIPLDLKAQSASFESQTLEVAWEDGETSSFPYTFLKQFSLSSDSFEQSTRKIAVKTWEKESLCSLPFLKYEDIVSTSEGLFKLMNTVAEYGVCILSDVPSQKGAVGEVGHRLSGQDYLQTTIYGEYWDVYSKADSDNIAYTTYGLEAHQDLCYYEGTPGIQLLHCLKFDDCVDGGENNFVDGFAVAKRLQQEQPEHFRTLCDLPATFHYVTDRHHMEFHRPHITLDAYTNDLLSIAWSPMFEGPLWLKPGDMQRYYKAYRAMAEVVNDSTMSVWHKLSAGEMLVFNNRRVLHGRQAFQLGYKEDGKPGERHLEGTYVSLDEFLSQHRVMARQLGGFTPKAGTGSYSRPPT
mmetsp:Transcript_20136/g.51384  ORF Transcript_20136/g.51384 Transcript_20136/m.51384 type:complete len:433 (-) Transcript_20136:2602-3900(-)